MLKIDTILCSTCCTCENICSHVFRYDKEKKKVIINQKNVKKYRYLIDECIDACPFFAISWEK